MSNPANPSSRWEEGRASTSARSSSPPRDETAAERLTDDLLVDILSRVPAKSLCRFMCVSNHWLSLIEHLDHRKGLPQTMSGFFYGRTITEDHEWLPGPPVHFTSAPGRRGPPIDTSCAFLPNHRRVDLLDCCNGLLLCRWYGFSAEVGEFHYLVCNPATKKWVMLPDSGQATSKVATTRLGFNPDLSSHFHVFELLQDSSWDGDYLTGAEVYSSETGKWVHKRMVWSELIRLTDPKLATAFLNGNLHFLTVGLESSQHYVAAVDTEGGKMEEVLSPWWSGQWYYEIAPPTDESHGSCPTD